MSAQGTPEWKAARLGLVTASRIADLMAKTKAGWGASRANYRAQLVAERLTGTVTESYTNAAMEWGTATEAEAVDAYAFYSGAEIAEVGFVPHPTIPMSGASPDRLVGTDGLLEIKCPQTGTHIETLLGGAVPGKYVKQIQWQLACTGRQWCDVVSYDPRMPEHMRLFTQRLARDDEAIGEITAAVVEFLAEVDAQVRALNRLYPEPHAQAAE